jgi:hypothetical protein
LGVTLFPGVVPADAAPTPVKTAMPTVASMSSVANKVRNTIILSELVVTDEEGLPPRRAVRRCDLAGLLPI